jgi:hypothetical protein
MSAGSVTAPAPAGAAVRRVDWAEQWARLRHDVIFTPVGGRRRSENVDDPTTAQLAQVAIAVPRVAAVPRDPDTDYWVTVTRKILQRGVRPPLSPRLDGLVPPVAGSAAGLAGFAWLGESDVDPSWKLDLRWERPFWDRARLMAPRAAAWLLGRLPLRPAGPPSGRVRDRRRPARPARGG